jgi:hypothetical protein
VTPKSYEALDLRRSGRRSQDWRGGGTTPSMGSRPAVGLAAGIRRVDLSGFWIRRRAAVTARVPPRRRSGSLARGPGRHGALALETAPTTAGTLSRGVCRRVGHPVAQRGFRDENWIQGGAG